MPKRLLLIGPGALGRSRVACFERFPEVKIVGAVARTAASAHRAAQDFGLPNCGTDIERVADEAQPDAVVICTVNSQHHRYTAWALEHDLDVFVEGPMVTTSEQAQEVVDLAREHGRLVEVGFQRRYHPVIQRARDLIQSRQYGPLIYGEVEFLWHMEPPPGQPDPWYLDDSQSGGMAVCHMSYGLNTLRWVLGNPQRVFAAGNNLAFNGKVSHETLVVTMMYDGGSVAHIIANFSAPKDFPSGVMKAHCLTGGFALQILHGVSGTFWMGDARETVSPPPAGSSDSEWGDDDLCAQCRAFAQALDTRTGLLNPPEDSLLELRLIESVIRSVGEGKPISLS